MTDEQIRMAMVLTPAYSDDADYAHKIRMGRAVLTAAALAQAAAEPASWTECERISNLPAVDEAIRALLEDQTADNATGLISAILAGAAPAAPSAEPVTLKIWCETCDGTGKVYQEHQRGCHVGGDHPCPDCDGNGWWQRAAPLMLNGLTAAETSATASVAGLSDPLRVVDVAAEKIAFCEWASAPLRANKLPLDTWDGPGQNGGFKNPQTYAVFYGWLSHSRHAEALLPAREPLTEKEILECVRSTGMVPPMGLQRDVGPYSITKPTYYLCRLVAAIETAHGITAPADQKEAP